MNLLKQSKPAYSLSSEIVLSECLLDEQAQIIKKNLAFGKINISIIFFYEMIFIYYFFLLAIGGWTNPNHNSIWNFLILTPENKQYLYKLENSRTGE